MTDRSEERTTYTKALEREIAAWVAAGRAASNEIVSLSDALTEAIRQRDEAQGLLRDVLAAHGIRHPSESLYPRLDARIRAFLANFKEDSTNGN